MTAPHIGNTGVNDEDPESRRIWVSGYVVRDPSRVVEQLPRDAQPRRRARRERRRRHLGHRHPRRHPAPARPRARCASGVFSGPDAALSPEDQLAIVRAAPEMAGRNLSAEVSVTEETVTPATRRAHRRPGDPRPRGQAVHRRQPRRPRLRGARAAAERHARAAAGHRAGRGVLLQRPRRPRGVRRPRRPAARRARRRPAVLRHLLRQPAARPRARPRHLQAAVRPPRHQPAGARQDAPDASRSPRTTTASR